MLGQVKVNEKSNEITAIPLLLEALMLDGNIVTIDAMGCQTKIAKSIIDKNADYILAVKDNHKNLSGDIKSCFDTKKFINKFEEVDCGHGRVETRRCSVITNLDPILDAENWKGNKSVIKLESIRYNKTTTKTETEKRYY